MCLLTPKGRSSSSSSYGRREPSLECRFSASVRHCRRRDRDNGSEHRFFGNCSRPRGARTIRVALRIRTTRDRPSADCTIPVVAFLICFIWFRDGLDVPNFAGGFVARIATFAAYVALAVLFVYRGDAYLDL